MGYKYRHRTDKGWSEWITIRTGTPGTLVADAWTAHKFLENEYLIHKSVTKSETGGIVWQATSEERKSRFNPFWQIIFDTPDMLTQELIALDFEKKGKK